MAVTPFAPVNIAIAWSVDPYTTTVDRHGCRSAVVADYQHIP
jgi:hypothetical protein